MHRLRLFGGVVLEGPDGPVRGRATQPKRLALLSLLGAARNHGWSREKLATLLWPEADPADARHHLSQSLYMLRRALGDEALTVHGDFIELNPAVVWTDAREFGESLEADEPERATELYSGPFLDGFFLRGAPDFEDWVDTERRRLADEYATAVESFALELAGSGEYRAAADAWRRLVTHDPYNSRAVVHLMTCLAEAGDPGNALVVAEEHADRMHQDLGVGLASEVEAMVERIREALPMRERAERQATQPQPDPRLIERLRAALTGRYEVESEVGQGGMATVFRARDLKHDRTVAIKVLHPELAASVGTDRFLREIEILARLVHPNILGLIDSGEADELLYFVMPFVEEASLRDRVERDGQLPIEDSVRIGIEVADALGYAHGLDIVHRDIKPENILFVAGHAVLSDFGIARAVSDAKGTQLTRTGLSVGSPSYMSPEQATGADRMDARSDLYSLGCVLYEMVGGEPPYTGPNSVAVLSRHLHADIPAVSIIRPHTPPELEAVIGKALAKAPADRFQSAEEMRDALSGDAPVPLPAPAAVTRSESMLARYVWHLALAVTLLVGGAWLTAWFTRSSNRAETVALDPELVAVLPFVNAGGAPALEQWSVVATGRIADGLHETGYVDVVEQGTAAAAWGVAVDPSTSRPGGGWIPALASQLGAGLLVSGEYYEQADSVFFQARLVDASDGTVVAELGPFAAPSNAVTQAIDALRESVMIHVVGPIILSPVEHADLPRSYEALLEFIEMRRATTGPSDSWDMALAHQHLLRAIALDTLWNWPVGRGLLDALNGQQYETADSLRAVLEARKTRLRPVQRVLQLPLATALLSGDRLGVLQAYRVARDSMPDVPTLHYYVAFGAQLNNRPLECLRAMEQGIEGEDPWDTLPWCLHQLGRHQAEVDTVRQGLTQYPDNSLLKVREAYALAGLGQAEAARAIQAETRGRAMDAETRFGLEVGLGLELKAHGNEAAGQAALDGGVAWYEGRPPAERQEPHHRYAHARALYAAGRWAEARLVFLSLQRELQADSTFFLRSQPDPEWPHAWHDIDVALLGYAGTLAARLGDQTEADRIDEELSRFDRPYLWGHHDYWRAAIAAVRGDRERAVELLANALSSGLMWYGFSSYFDYPKWGFHIDPDFESLRGYPPFETLIGPQD